MSSISDDEGDSIELESSISQQAKISSVSTQSLPISDLISIGEYFIVKDTFEYLEEALPFLKKADKVFIIFFPKLNFIEYRNKLDRLELESSSSQAL